MSKSPKKENPEKQLIEALRRGENEAYKTVYKEHFSLLKSFILKNGGSVTDAQDVFQEALVTFAKKLVNPDFELTCSIRTYLYSVVRFKWLNFQRDKKNLVELDEEFLILTDTSDTEIEKKKQYEKKHQLMSKVLVKLKEDCKKIIIDYYYKNIPLLDIAAALGLTEGSIRVKKHRCMKYFAKLIDDEIGFNNL